MASLFSCIFANVWLAAVVRDKSRGAAAKLFDDRVASVVKWTQRTHETGSSAARPIGGKRRYLLAVLLARLNEKPGGENYRVTDYKGWSHVYPAQEPP